MDLKRNQKEFPKAMKMKKYVLIAELFAYPSSDLPDNIMACVNEITSNYPESIRTLSSFEKHLNRLDLVISLLGELLKLLREQLSSIHLKGRFEE